MVVRAYGSSHLGREFNAHSQHKALVVIGMIAEDLHTAVGGTNVGVHDENMGREGLMAILTDCVVTQVDAGQRCVLESRLRRFE